MVKGIGTTERHARKWMNSLTYEGGLMRHEGKELINIINQLREENEQLRDAFKLAVELMWMDEGDVESLLKRSVKIKVDKSP